MAVTYGFFNSVNGDRKYNADQMSEYFRGIVNQGVFQHLDGGLQVTAGTGLAVNVAAGRAIIQNRWVQNSASLPLSISAASETYGRKDAVVLRLNISARTVTIAVKTGTPAASPTAPAMTRDATTYEMALAYVNVSAGASSVTVTDKRSDTTVCGWATVAQQTSGEVDAMLNAMKTGFDGVTYSSPAAMVQGCDEVLQEQIDLISEANLFESSDITSGKRINPEGAFIDSAGYWISDYMEVIPGAKYYKNSPAEDSNHRIVYFNSSKVVISGSVSTNNITIAPVNAVYAVICGQTADLSNVIFKMGSAVDLISRTSIQTEAGKIQDQVDQITGNNSVYQYVSSSDKVANSFYYLQNGSITIITGASANGWNRYLPFHLEAGTYSCSKIHRDVSYLKFDDTTIQRFVEAFPDGGGASYVAYTFTLTQGATIYVSLENAYIPFMLVSGDTLPTTYHDKGIIITGLNSSLNIGSYTLDDVNDFIDQYSVASTSEFMYIKDGKVGSNGRLAQYAEVDMKSKIKKVMARTIWLSNTSTVVTLIAVKAIRENVGGPVADIGNGSVHINFGQSSVQVQYFEGGTLHNVTGYNYSTAITADGETEYEFGYEFMGSDTIKIYLPDGTTRELTDSHFDSNNGNYFIFETSSAAQTEEDSARVLFTGVFCSTDDAIPYLRDNFKRADGALAVANTGHPYRVFKASRTSIYDF